MRVRHKLGFILSGPNDWGTLKNCKIEQKWSFSPPPAHILKRNEQLAFPSSLVHCRAGAAPPGPNQLTQTGCKIDLTAHERGFGGGEGSARESSARES